MFEKIRSIIARNTFCIISIVLVLVLFGITKCLDTPIAADSNSELVLDEIGDLFVMRSMCVIKDTETGVNYICIIDTWNGGSSITPRLNPDGTLYVSE